MKVSPGPAASAPEHGASGRATPVRSPRDGFDWRLEVCLLMDEVSRMQRIMAGRQMAAYGLTHIQWLAITYILHHEGLTQTDLQNLLEITRGGCTQLVDRLVKGGLVERRAGADRRINHLFITPEAERILDTARGVSEAMHARMFIDVDEAEGRRAIEILGRLKDRINAMEGVPLADEPGADT